MRSLLGVVKDSLPEARAALEHAETCGFEVHPGLKRDIEEGTPTPDRE